MPRQSLSIECRGETGCFSASPRGYVDYPQFAGLRHRNYLLAGCQRKTDEANPVYDRIRLNWRKLDKYESLFNTAGHICFLSSIKHVSRDELTEDILLGLTMDQTYWAMANSSAIKLLVHWGNVHRRPIQIQDDDSLSDIERSCYDLFSVSSRDDTNGFQVQFYDRNFKVYVDLCDGTWNDFQQLRRLLSSQCAPMRTAKEWQLKLVPSMRRMHLLAVGMFSCTGVSLLGPASVRPNAPQMNQAMQMAQQVHSTLMQLDHSVQPSEQCLL